MAAAKVETPDARTPFFIVGAMRSGTTLLRLMLASHPRLAIPPESHFLPGLLGWEESSGGLTRSREKVIEWLVAHQRLADFGLGAEWMRAVLAKLEPFTTRSITSTLFTEYARREGKPRWGDKTPRYRSFIPQLARLFPEAKFIHVLRDGRDTALSAWRAPFVPRTWSAAAYEWRNALRDARTGQRFLPSGDFLEIRYEGLILDPQAVLTEVCGFLREEYRPEMLRFSEIARKEVPAWEAAWHARLQKPLDPGNVGKWKTDLSPAQVLLFERVAGRELAAAGYARADLAAGPLAHARSLLMQGAYLLRSSAVRLSMFLDSKRRSERML